MDASEGGDDGEGREEGRSDQPLKPWLFVLVDDYQPPAQYSQSRFCFVDGHGFVRFSDMSDELTAPLDAEKREETKGERSLL